MEILGESQAGPSVPTSNKCTLDIMETLAVSQDDISVPTINKCTLDIVR